MREGGSLDGKLLNPNEVPRVTYDFQTTSGITVSIPGKHVERTRNDDKPEVLEYAMFAPLQKDTVDDQLALAEWCRERRLDEAKRVHAARVIELEPENAAARLMLHHEKIDGIWRTRAEHSENLGYIRYKNAWRTQQEVEIEERKDEFKKRQNMWRKELAKIRNEAGNNTALKEKITSIRDTAAIPVLTEMLRKEGNPDARIFYIRALSNIGTPAAVMEIAAWAIEESLQEVRLTCFEEIRRHPVSIPVVSRYYASCLIPNPNQVNRSEIQLNTMRINRAAYAIGQIGGKTVLPELIDALETIHFWKGKVVMQGNVANDGGLVWGDKSIEGSDPIKNIEVLRALQRLTGQDFQYDKQAWRYWLMQSRKTPTFDARRG